VRFVQIHVMKAFDQHRQPKISDSLKISDFANSLRVLRHPSSTTAVCS